MRCQNGRRCCRGLRTGAMSVSVPELRDFPATDQAIRADPGRQVVEETGASHG
jgi:hypothetical protein